MKPGEAYPGEFEEFMDRRLVEHVAVGTVGSEDGHEEVSLDVTLEDGETVKARVAPNVARVVAEGLGAAANSIEAEQTKPLRQQRPATDDS